MRIEKNKKMDENVVVKGKADLWQAGKRGKCLRGDSGAGI